MDQIGEPESTPTLEQIREQFEAWRQGRKKRSAIPEELWQSAVNLRQDHSISKVPSTLGLNHAVLKHRVGAYGINHSASKKLGNCLFGLFWYFRFALSLGLLCWVFSQIWLYFIFRNKFRGKVWFYRVMILNYKHNKYPVRSKVYRFWEASLETSVIGG